MSGAIFLKRNLNYWVCGRPRPAANPSVSLNFLAQKQKDPIPRNRVFEKMAPPRGAENTKHFRHFLAAVGRLRPVGLSTSSDIASLVARPTVLVVQYGRTGASDCAGCSRSSVNFGKKMAPISGCQNLLPREDSNLGHGGYA